MSLLSRKTRKARRPLSRQPLAILTLSASAAWLVSAPAFAAPQTPQTPQAPQSPPNSSSSNNNLPAASLTVDDIEFGPSSLGPLAGLPFLSVKLADNQIRITEGVLVRPTQRTAAGRLTFAPGEAKAPLWAGPIAEAQFVHEIKAGTDTLRHRDGRILWTNAAQTADPDLLLQSTDAGEAQLLGKGGTLLWSGTLPGTPGDSKVTEGVIRGYQIDSSGIHISSTGKDNDPVTVTDNEKRVLWSGTLPKEPVILIRRGTDFTFWGPNRSASGSDRVTEVRLAAEPGEMTLEDSAGKRIGTRSLDLLRSTSKTVESSKPDAPTRESTRLFAPRAFLTVPGWVQYTFKDSAGRAIGWGSARHGAQGQAQGPTSWSKKMRLGNFIDRSSRPSP